MIGFILTLLELKLCQQPFQYPTFSTPTFTSSPFSIGPDFIFAFFGLFILTLVIIIISKAFGHQKANNITLLKPEFSPKTTQYIAELTGKEVGGKNLEIRINKYTKSPPKSSLARFFGPYEIAIPKTQANEERKTALTSNILKFCFLMGLWVVISYFGGIYISILSFMIVLYLYSKWVTPVIDAFEKITETKIIPSNANYQMLDLNDLLYGWLFFQKKSFIGLFKSIPPIAALRYSEVNKSTFAEIEADAEYFTIEHNPCTLPYSQAAKQQYFGEPFPVMYPTEFGESSQEFAIYNTLEKCECETCLGSGIITCSSCGGSGQTTCPWCHGWGYIDRTETKWVTDSDGQSHSEMETVRESCTCFNGEVTCSSCGGSGHVKCPTCDGEGQLGHFLIRKYLFHHLNQVKVVKEQQDQLTQDVELTDLPNEDARLITIDKNTDYFAANPEESPTIDAETMVALQVKKAAFESEINQLPNLIFDQYAYREFPELKVLFQYRGKSFKLLGRGYKPLQKKYTKMDPLPVSVWRILGLLSPLIIVTILILLHIL